MSNESVTVGCRLPNGYVLEVGYEVTTKMGDKIITQYRKLANYARYALKGTHAHTAEMRRQKIQLPAQRDVPPFINRNVPKAVWDEWVRKNPNSYLLKQRLLFEVKGGGTANEQAAALDAAAAGSAPFQPVDASKPMTIGNDKVETAVWDKD